MNMNMKVKLVVSNNVVGFGFPFGFKSKRKSSERVSLGKILSFVVGMFWREAKRIQSYHVLSIAGALVPSIQKLSSNLLSGSMQDPDMRMSGTRNPTYGLPQQHPPLPSTQMVGVHNPLSEFSSQTATPQQYQTQPSQVAGTHDQPSGYPTQVATQNSPPRFDTRTAGARNSPFEFPS